MSIYLRFTVLVLFLLSEVCVTSAQTPSDDGSDTSAAQAAVQAMQASSQSSQTALPATPALKAAACKVAVPYVESQSGLLGDWDRGMTKYTIDRDDGMASIQRVKADLLSDTWWARSSGPDVAREVSTFSNLLIHISAAMSPAGEAVSFARDVSAEFGVRVKENSVRVFQAIQNGSNAMDAIQGGTADLAILAAQESLKKVGAGQFAAIIDVMKDVQTNAKQAQEGAEFKATVQQQLRNLDELLNKYANDMTIQRERLEAVEGVKDAVIAACNSDQPIQTDPQFTNTDIEPPQNPTQSFVPTPDSTPSVRPWWLVILSTPIPTRGTNAKPAKPGPDPASSNPDHCPPCTPTASSACICR
jgi:hypothetical protein